MRWESGRRSTNVEDRRGMGGGAIIGGGGIGMLILVLIISFITGTNPLELLQQTDAGAPVGDQFRQALRRRMIRRRRWSRRCSEAPKMSGGRSLGKGGSRYQDPVLVLFDGSVASACGMASSAVGPFYCPGDHKLYLDLSFFRELAQRFGAPGEFAQAYVVAHEVGHHVQTLLGISSQVNQARARASEVQGNQLSVMQELQADCYAGVWGNHAARKDWLEEGDVEDGLRAAAAIGDDRLQSRVKATWPPRASPMARRSSVNAGSYAG